MNLAIDIGNSRSKFALFENDALLQAQVFENFSIPFLEKIFQENKISHVILSTVLDYENEIKNFLEKKSTFIELTPETPLPIKNLYQTPHTLGKDRIAAAVAATAIFSKTPTLVVDAGTCITYEFTTADGEYLGGAISPGIKLRLKALKAFTGRLPLVEPELTNFLIGKTTKESILSGVVNGARLEVAGMIKAYSEKNENLKTLLTGGDMAFFETALKNQIFAVPNLVLIGLNKILNYNVALR